MHYAAIVIRHSETGDIAGVVFIKVVFHPWTRIKKLHSIVTVFRGKWRNITDISKHKFLQYRQTEHRFVFSNGWVWRNGEVRMLRGSEGTLQIYLNINCYSTARQNTVLFSVTTTCFGLTRLSLSHLYKIFHNIVQCSENCAFCVDPKLLALWTLNSIQIVWLVMCWFVIVCKLFFEKWNIFSVVLISTCYDQEGNKLERQKILMFLYRINL
jgi:hypothetical protein